MAGPDFDVVIIGSGAGGGASAWGLARHGLKVLLLEAGPAYSPAEYPLDKEEWEELSFPDRVSHKERYTFGPLQPLAPESASLRSWNHISGYKNTTDHRAAGTYLHMRGVGGSTLVFSGEAQRLHPGAMQMQTRFGVAADWPLSYAELEPYYCLAEQIVGVAGASDDAVRPRSAPYPLPAHRLSYASTRVAEGCRSLGLKLRPNPVAILSRPYDGRPECNYCAQCNRGCSRTDKGSTDVTFIRRAVGTGRCVIQAESRVVALEAGPVDRIGKIVYADSRGTLQQVSGRVVLVACGAVETPRLLLASKNSHAPEGVGNDSGQVGRNFMETLFWFSSGLHEDDLGSYRGIPVDSVCWDFNAPDAIPGVAGGCRFSPAVAEAELAGPVNYATRVVSGWGRQHKETMRKVFGRALVIVAMGESLPNSRAYIDLDPHQKDAAGMALARINTFVAPMDLRRLDFMSRRTREILLASGVKKIIEEFSAYDLFNASHVFGTCRMGSDPEQSVVDRFCRSHRWQNLFVVDASVFPSSGGGESPSLTIEALALRTADHIHRLAGRGEL